MYLITVAAADEGGQEGPLPITSLAASLGISPVSANQMVRKLAERGLVDYHPYRGVVLTTAGRAAARRVLRGRRLWGAFLVEHLDFSPAEADALACRLEHVTPPSAADRLSRFLGEPPRGPLGRPIPPTGGGEEPRPGTSLAVVPPGVSAEVLGIAGGAAVRAFLEAEGIRPGCRVTVEGRGESGAVLVAAPAGRAHLEATAAAAVTVRLRPAQGGSGG